MGTPLTYPHQKCDLLALQGVDKGRDVA